MKITKLGNHPLALKLCDSSFKFPIVILVPYIQPFCKYYTNTSALSFGEKKHYFKADYLLMVGKQTFIDLTLQFKILKLGAIISCAIGEQHSNKFSILSLDN